MKKLGWVFFLWIVFSSHVLAFDYRVEGRSRIGGSLIFEAPTGFSHTDREVELRLGAVGTAWKNETWILDYEVIGELRHEGGALEQVGIGDSFNANFFRAWARLDKGNLKFRGGRQQILFGSGSLFRPLGFFDNRIISGVIPQTFGVDGVRATWFPSGTSLLEGWLIPSGIGDRVIAGLRTEIQWGMLELGAAAQYKPVSDLDFLNNFNLELAQFGYHLKGEKVVGFWNETRLDVEQGKPGDPLRVQTVFGVDYTFNVGEGLHALIEYSLTAEERGFTRTDIFKGERFLHQVGLQLDQPVGINTVWRLFAFMDLEDHSFQIAPQIEYALTQQTFLYGQLQIGGVIGGDSRSGRLFRRASTPNGTESRIGMTLITFF